jgi:putative Mn2+ efflux pump MntP
MRTSVLIAIIGLVFMVIGFIISAIVNDVLLSSSLFIIGFLLNILGVLMINRDIENLIIKLEMESNKPGPEDIKRRPLRKPRRG